MCNKIEGHISIATKFACCPNKFWFNEIPTYIYASKEYKMTRVKKLSNF